MYDHYDGQRQRILMTRASAQSWQLKTAKQPADRQTK
jgi:hypothetical protein